MAKEKHANTRWATLFATELADIRQQRINLPIDVIDGVDAEQSRRPAPFEVARKRSTHRSLACGPSPNFIIRTNEPTEANSETAKMVA